MFLGVSMVLFSTVMTILAIYYSLIKRAILLFGMRRKLKKNEIQNLTPYKTEKREQNGEFATAFSAFSFQKSLLLSRKDSLIIFSIAFIVLVIFAGSMVFAALLPNSAVFLFNHMPLLLKAGTFVIQWLFLVCACVVVSLPVVLIFHSLLHYGVKKTSRRLETLA
ncbi:hypothetical protein GGR08_000562 [Bartonella fuyuanensis]|uniref:Uncharacterized protein n=2 Tax=Bartonella fuyuanensis TaxID=1460968 RepID=A0A840E3B4_9HYPH|nr:hypothetical protein [Bartonella fuyuanensis]MBB4076269.1 hypothetical protein [Bartonella fuyuanensis]